MKKVITSIFVLGLLTLAFAEDYGANDLYQNIKSSYGSKDSINENVNKPTTGVNDFKTVDNSTSFNAPMECPSSQIAVLISFSQDGGDYRAIIKIDRDLDGSFDYTYTTINISGVCTNGIVNCDKGTWNNCNFYYWKANNDKSIILEPTSDTKLVGSCSCTNASCGITQLDQPLFSMIGGGISQALMNVDSNFLISKSKWNGNNLELFGQAPKDCSKPDFNSYGESNPEQYYKNQTPPSVSIVDIASQQGNDPYSPYSTVEPISNLEYKQGKTIGLPNKQQCEIKRIVYSSIDTFYEDCDNVFTDSNGENWCIVTKVGDVPECGKRCRNCDALSQKINGSVENLKYKQKWAVYFKISYLSGDKGRYWSRKVINDGQEVENSTVRSNTSNCLDFLKVLGSANEHGETHNVSASQKALAWGKNNNYPPKYGLIYILKGQTYQNDKFDVRESNTCPSNCTLINEWVCDKDGNNCIQTVKDGNPLTVPITKQCFNVTTNLSTYIVCSDGSNITVTDRWGGVRNVGSGWFYIKREYNCGTQNLDVDLSRTRYVVQNTKKEDGQISYTDIDGSQGSLNIASIENNTTNCSQPVCLVKIPKTDTSVFADRKNRSQLPSGKDSNELEVRTCDESNGNFSCPLFNGDILVEDCKCDIEELKAGFETAVTSLEVVKQASKDMICSSSPP